MEDDEVLDREAPDKPAAPKDGKAETVTIPKAEWERSQRELGELRGSEKYWSERARGAGGNGKAPPAEKEDPGIDVSDLVPKVTGDKDVDEAIFSDPDKWLEAIAKGPKAITALIKKEGFVNAAEVAEIARKVARRTVDVERTKITTDNRLMTKFPELADNTSELFKATAEEYREMIEFDPSSENSPVTLFAAAKAAKARLAGARRRTNDDDDYGYDRAGEEERRTRIAAQDGSRGGGRRERADDDERIGPQARAVIEGMGLKQDAFLAAKKRVAGIGGSRR